MGIKIIRPVQGGGLPVAEERIVLTDATTSIGTLTVTSSTVEVKVDVSRLALRKQVYIFNISDEDMYIAFYAPIVLANGDGIILEAGTETVLDVDPQVSEPIYIRTDTASVDVRIMEVK